MDAARDRSIRSEPWGLLVSEADGGRTGTLDADAPALDGAIIFETTWQVTSVAGMATALAAGPRVTCADVGPPVPGRRDPPAPGP